LKDLKSSGFFYYYHRAEDTFGEFVKSAVARGFNMDLIIGLIMKNKQQAVWISKGSRFCESIYLSKLPFSSIL